MDKNYWENIYAKQNKEFFPSLFAQYVVKQFDIKGKHLVELGCGNGRDALYFAREEARVLAIDQCENAFELMKYRCNKIENIEFLCADFTMLDKLPQHDIVYSRFTLHSISLEEELRVVKWAYHNLHPSGKFCIEVRGQKNEIFGLGTPVDGEKDAFIYNDHYRRFLNFDDFCNTLKSIGFKIEFAAEEKGFAPYNGDDETYIRVIAIK